MGQMAHLPLLAPAVWAGCSSSNLVRRLWDILALLAGLLVASTCNSTVKAQELKGARTTDFYVVIHRQPMYIFFYIPRFKSL